MLAAVCETLGWEYGRVLGSRSRGRRCSASAPGRRVTARSPNSTTSAGRPRSRAGVGLPGTGLESRASRPGFRDVARRSEFPARGAAADRAGLHGAFALPILRRADVLGVMEFFSRDDPPAGRRRCSADDDRGRRADRPVRRAQARRRRARAFLHAVARPALRRQPRRLLHARQSGLDARTSASTTTELRATPFLDFVHPDDRDRHDRRDVGA